MTDKTNDYERSFPNGKCWRTACQYAFIESSQL